ncbi:MAG: chromosome segregation protein SMC [Pseudomonadota bacterium]|nr:chromosome segregation protein SMC [Pseudomonadota bacterium]
MRLSKIKLAGFKSFVDPTTIVFPGSLVGVVGPNGCGKSNIIDAVRWVMGESSAKHLRGDALSDVIFNGSSTRKPVGQASIELVFDNSSGQLGGPYAQYAEISVKRLLSRDGTSHYYLNNGRCRRRDITDLFLGTGLGSRSYAIIEQGMISRLIEAKPDELRVLLEEASGVSKYKERRRETENRIRHTRENLTRLSDLRDELEKQLAHLQRQAKNAEKYKQYRADQRKTEAELAALHWREHQRQTGQLERALTEKETAHQAAIAAQRALEAAIEKARARQNETNEAFQASQERYFNAGATVARLEQEIQHAKELRQRQEQERLELERTSRKLSDELAEDQRAVDQAGQALAELEPAFNRALEEEQAAKAAVRQAEQQGSEVQKAWEALQARINEAERTLSVESTRQDQITQRDHDADQRLARLNEECTRLNAEALEQELSQLAQFASQLEVDDGNAHQALRDETDRITRLRGQLQQVQTELHQTQEQLQKASGRLASLQALQQAALTDNARSARDWLRERSLDESPRLAQSLDVAAGWERAVEMVLGSQLDAVCVPLSDDLLAQLAFLEQGRLSLIDPSASASGSRGTQASGSLAAQVSGAGPLAALLEPVLTAATLSEAIARSEQLAPGESVITPDGFWLSASWVRVVHPDPKEDGVLKRERDIKSLTQQSAGLDRDVGRLSESLEALRGQLSQAERERDRRQSIANDIHRRLADAKAKRSSTEQRLRQTQERMERIAAERLDLQRWQAEWRAQREQIQSHIRSTTEQLAGAKAEQSEMTARREAIQSELAQRRHDQSACSEKRQKLDVDRQAARSRLESGQRQIERLLAQHQQIVGRQQSLTETLAELDQPEQARQTGLEQALAKRSEAERGLAEARNSLAGVDQEIRELQQQRDGQEAAVGASRDVVERLRMQRQEQQVRCQSFEEKLAEMGHQAQAVADSLPDEAEPAVWNEQLQGIVRRIERLGPINLAAIDEYQSQSERKSYLDQQDADLTAAMETLEQAMAKIDRETRARFQDTFNRLNESFRAKFPRLFGGGEAYLELESSDLLESGVRVMARPPGKRNSHIHLLSGGEKALTAVALVFGIFELNPAPFCMLDEVDAPLDEANVGRFCELVRDMSERVQLILVTHNKTTMEMTQQLLGITMKEPGVSRVVSVDIEEAVEMAAV